MELTVAADHGVKSKNSDKYPNLARELKKMKVTVMPLVIGTHGTVPNGLVQGLEDLEITIPPKPRPEKKPRWRR